MDFSTVAAVHAKLNVNMQTLGFVMADYTSCNIVDYLPTLTGYEFYSKGSLPHANGLVGVAGLHVTLLSGLLEPGHVWKQHVDDLLEPVLNSGFPSVQLMNLSWFPVSSGDENAVALVAHVDDVSKKVFEEANQRLKALPHVEVFPYVPHVTLGYFKTEVVDSVDLESFTSGSVVVNFQQLNYGV